jgi:hypothetical protein
MYGKIILFSETSKTYHKSKPQKVIVKSLKYSFPRVVHAPKGCKRLLMNIIFFSAQTGRIFLTIWHYRVQCLYNFTVDFTSAKFSTLFYKIVRIYIFFIKNLVVFF